MTRKVAFEFKDREYKVNSYDIDGILDKSGLRKDDLDEREGLARLGLMYIDAVSWSGGAVGDIPLRRGDDFGLTDAEFALLTPAFEVVVEHYVG